MSRFLAPGVYGMMPGLMPSFPIMGESAIVSLPYSEYEELKKKQTKERNDHDATKVAKEHRAHLNLLQRRLLAEMTALLLKGMADTLEFPFQFGTNFVNDSRYGSGTNQTSFILTVTTPKVNWNLYVKLDMDELQNSNEDIQALVNKGCQFKRFKVWATQQSFKPRMKLDNVAGHPAITIDGDPVNEGVGVAFAKALANALTQINDVEKRVIETPLRGAAAARKKK